MTNEERESRFNGTAKQKQISALKRKQGKIDAVKKLFKANIKRTKIAKELGLDYKTVCKYLTLENAEISSNFGSKRQSILDPFKNLIETALKKAMTTNKIFDMIRKKGYEGSERTLRLFIANWKSEHSKELLAEANGKKIEWISRKTLLETCYKSVDEIHGLKKALLKKVFKRYPTFKKLYNLIINFKEIVNEKEHWKLDKWLNNAGLIGVKGLKTFSEGVKRDLKAVKNAIEYEYNNGLAEGFINKIKVIKRTMYGKCSFETLKKKCLLI